MKEGKKSRRVLGWIAVGLSTVITSFWAFWGIIENFHEGWYHQSLWANLGLMLIQYLSPMLIFMAVTLLSIYRGRIGAGVHILVALFAAWFFNAFTSTLVLFILLPLVGIGALYWFGEAQPRKRAVLIAAGLPLLVMIACGASPVLRVAQRVDDGNRQARLVAGHGVELVWAPAGPGWPDSGTDWETAIQSCKLLESNGLALADEAQGIWRLPTVEEAVASMARHGENSGGVWDAEAGRASYEREPDKESPLWDTHSQVIYWWTATEIDDERAYMIAYDGDVWSRAKQNGPAYLGYRCVKSP